MRSAVVRAVRHLALHRGDHSGMRVSEKQCAVSHRVVDELATVDEPLV